MFEDVSPCGCRGGRACNVELHLGSRSVCWSCMGAPIWFEVRAAPTASTTPAWALRRASRAKADMA